MFGAAISLTGVNTNEGGLVKDGYNFWKKTVNDAGGLVVGNQRYMVDIRIYDDASNSETSAKLTERLITEDKIDFILGPYGSNATLTAVRSPRSIRSRWWRRMARQKRSSTAASDTSSPRSHRRKPS